MSEPIEVKAPEATEKPAVTETPAPIADAKPNDVAAPATPTPAPIEAPTPSITEKVTTALPTTFTAHFLYFLGAFIFILCAGTCGVLMLSSFYKRQIDSYKQAPFNPPEWAPKSLFPRDHSFYWEHEITLTESHITRPTAEDLMQQLT